LKKVRDHAQPRRIEAREEDLDLVGFLLETLERSVLLL